MTGVEHPHPPLERRQELIDRAHGTWKRMMWTAGFDRIEVRKRFKLKSTEGFSVTARGSARAQVMTLRPRC